MTKILVTGSAGLIGRQVTIDLIQENFDVYSCYNETKPKFGTPIQLDLLKNDKIKEIFHTIKPDIVIHLAALTDVEKCEIDKEQAIFLNTDSTKTLAIESEKHKAFFVYISTDYVFDGDKGLRNENDDVHPINFYGKSKLDGEIAVKNSGTQYAIVRTSTPFGLHPTKKSFPLWIKENLEANKEIHVLNDQFTSPTFVPNLSKMIIEVVKKQITGIIHLADNTRISRYEFAKMIVEKFNLDKSLLKPAKINDMKWNAIRPRDSSLDVSRAEEILDYKPQKLERSLEIFVNQIKNFEDKKL